MDISSLPTSNKEGPQSDIEHHHHNHLPINTTCNSAKHHHHHHHHSFSLILADMPSSFLGIYRAVYAYAPQSEGELTLADGDILYVLEKSTEDDWWKAKKRTSSSEEEEPVGLIPNNYVEEVGLRRLAPPTPSS